MLQRAIRQGRTVHGVPLDHSGARRYVYVTFDFGEGRGDDDDAYDGEDDEWKVEVEMQPQIWLRCIFKF